MRKYLLRSVWTEMILIHPPVSKPCEPPAGIARLSGALNHHGIKHTVLDANREGLLYLLKTSPAFPSPSRDTWTMRAVRHLPRHLASLNSWEAYRSNDRYRRAVKDLNRILEMAARSRRVLLGLANYEHEELTPVRSADLLRAAENPEDNPFYPYFGKRLRELLEAEQPSMVGFSLNFLTQALCTFAMVGFLRRSFPGVKLALGGGLVTSWLRRPHGRNPFGGLVDHLVAGPGEAPLLSLIGVRDLENRSEKRVESNPYRPNYESLPTGDYLSPGPILPYSTSSGCYWSKCSFCPEKAEGNPYMAIPSKTVTTDLLYLVDKQKPVLIHLLDNAIVPTIMEAISEHPPGAPWYGFARMTRHLADADFCSALKQSGCVMLQLGLESGDQTVLDTLQKGVDLKEASAALRSLRKAGIATYVYLLFGTPPEGPEEAQKTFEFVVQHHDCIDFLNLAVFNMPIGGAGPLPIETKSFYEGDLSLYASFEHPKGWSRPLIRQFLDKKFKRHPAISPILRRDPPVFTSNHAPFFCPALSSTGVRTIPQNKTVS